MSGIDPITVQVIGYALAAASREMGVTLRKTSCSPIFNEGNDYSCAIFTADGDIVSHGEFLPIHLGSLSFSVRSVMTSFDVGDLHDGDQVILNDPYIGGTHLPDVTIVAPIYADGAIVGYAANRAHHVDIGGTSPGSFFSAARENYQEGLRISPIKIVREDVVDRKLVEMIVANCRLPSQVRVDLESQMSANRTAIRRVTELAKRYGTDVVESSMRTLLDQSEQRMRQAISRLPDGEYVASDYVDNDGITDVAREIRVAVRIEGDAIEVDFEGSSPQVDGPINSVLGYTYSGVYMVLQAATDPDILPNAGCYRPVTILAPKGSIVNPHFPAACTGGNEVACIVHNVVFRAMAQVEGALFMACDHGSSNNMLISGHSPATGERYVIYEYPEGGWGGNADRDGLSAIWSIVGNTWNVPVEAVEQRFPVRVERYELREDSGGAGTYRGGLGIRRDHRILDHDAVVSIVANRVRVPPWGLEGGSEGAAAGFIIDADTPAERSAAPEFGSKAHDLVLPSGAVITQLTAGGGGWGDPRHRDASQVTRDVVLGYVTPDSAQRDYGVVVGPDGNVDESETASLRETHQRLTAAEGAGRHGV